MYIPLKCKVRVCVCIYTKKIEHIHEKKKENLENRIEVHGFIKF